MGTGCTKALVMSDARQLRTSGAIRQTRESSAGEALDRPDARWQSDLSLRSSVRTPGGSPISRFARACGLQVAVRSLASLERADSRWQSDLSLRSSVRTPACGLSTSWSSRMRSSSAPDRRWTCGSGPSRLSPDAAWAAPAPATPSGRPQRTPRRPPTATPEAGHARPAALRPGRQDARSGAHRSRAAAGA